MQFSDETPVSPNEEGRFQFPNRPAAPALVEVSGLPGNFYIREVRFNGVAARDQLVYPSSFANVHNLELVLDDSPATVAGTVVDGDDPVPDAVVFLVRWPPSNEDVFLSARRETSDHEGHVDFTRLPPGEYRILGVRPEDAGALDRPGVLRNLLGRAERVRLSIGATERLTLRPATP